MTLPTPVYLTDSSSFTDYRPAIDVTGNSVIFERTPANGGMTTLQIIKDIRNPIASPFLSGPSPASQTRPDWCWGTGNVLFNGAANNSDTVSVWAVEGGGVDPTQLPGTLGAFYPRWSLWGITFVTENSGTAASPNPCNTVFSFLDTRVLFSNVDGTDTAGVPMFGGMPGVSRNDLPLIAYAGQPAIPGGWNGPVYDENVNYIFLNTWVGGPGGGFVSTPMEANAPIGAFDPNFEGRAPDWSPDGNWIAFESNRSGQGFAIYLCNLAASPRTVIQVTDPALNAQHARFFPDGTKLIMCIKPDKDSKTTGIAWVDISGLLG